MACILEDLQTVAKQLGIGLKHVALGNATVGGNRELIELASIRTTDDKCVVVEWRHSHLNASVVLNGITALVAFDCQWVAKFGQGNSIISVGTAGAHHVAIADDEECWAHATAAASGGSRHAHHALIDRTAHGYTKSKVRTVPVRRVLGCEPLGGCCVKVVPIVGIHCATWIAVGIVVVEASAHCTHTHELAVGTKSNRANLVVEDGHIVAHVEDALGAKLLNHLLGVVVNYVEVSKFAFMREYDGRVAILQCLSHSAHDAVVGGAVVLTKYIGAGEAKITRLCWIGIVLIYYLVGYIVLVLEFDKRVASVVGGNSSVNRCFKRLVTLGCSLYCIVAWFKVEECEEAVPLVVNSIGCNLVAVFLEHYLGAIKRQPLVVAAIGVVVEVVDDFLVQVLHGTSNFTLAVEVEAPVGGYTASLADSLQAVIVEVQSAVARWLIGVEESLEQITGNAMLEHS